MEDLLPKFFDMPYICSAEYYRLLSYHFTKNFLAITSIYVDPMDNIWA